MIRANHGHQDLRNQLIISIIFTTTKYAVPYNQGTNPFTYSRSSTVGFIQVSFIPARLNDFRALDPILSLSLMISPSMLSLLGPFLDSLLQTLFVCSIDWNNFVYRLSKPAIPYSTEHNARVKIVTFWMYLTVYNFPLIMFRTPFLQTYSFIPVYVISTPFCSCTIPSHLSLEPL